MNARPANPYEVLRLPATATLDAVIRRTRERCDDTMDRGLQAGYRRAAEQLRLHPLERACCQFWEPPETCYDVPAAPPPRANPSSGEERAHGNR